MGERCNSTSSVRTHDCVDCSSQATKDRARSSEDRNIAQEKMGSSAADLQKIGRDLPKIGRSRKRAQSASMTLSSLSRAARMAIGGRRGSVWPPHHSFPTSKSPNLLPHRLKADSRSLFPSFRLCTYAHDRALVLRCLQSQLCLDH